MVVSFAEFQAFLSATGYELVTPPPSLPCRGGFYSVDLKLYTFGNRGIYQTKNENTALPPDLAQIQKNVA
jgi:hypothetical protein